MSIRKPGTYIIRTNEGWKEAIWHSGWFTANSVVDFNSAVQGPKAYWFTESVLEVGNKIR